MSPSELMEHWRFRNHRVQLAHYETSRRFERLHLCLGLPAIGLSTLAGTTVFATLSNRTDSTTQIAVGFLSVAAAVLTGLQTFLKYSELSEKHRMAGARFANLKHRIELLSIASASDQAAVRKELEDIEATWSKLREESPTLPSRVWRQIEKSMPFNEYEKRFGHIPITQQTSNPASLHGT